MIVDTHLDINTLIALLGTVGTVFYFIVSMKSDVRALVAELSAVTARVSQFESRLEAIATNFDTRLQKIADVLVDLARQEERLNSIDERGITLRKNLDAINDRVTSLERGFSKPKPKRAA